MACSVRLFVAICIPLVAQCHGTSVALKSGRSSERDGKEQVERISDSVLRHYNRNVAPIGDDGEDGKKAILITVSMHIISVTEIDDQNRQLKVNLYLRQKWKDSQLAYNGVGPDSIKMSSDKIWIPDTFFVNALSAERHMIDQPNEFVRVGRDGTVAYSTKLSLVLSCSMHFEQFPFDEQTCVTTLESYGYTANELEYTWENSTAPVTLDDSSIEGPLFRLLNVTTYSGALQTSSGLYTYSFVRFSLILRRQFQYYLMRYILPTTMLVILSWCAFWIHPSRVGARVTVGILTILAITALGFCHDFPRAPYVKAMDYWTGGTLCLAFFAFVETIFVTASHSKRLEKAEDIFSTTDPEKLPIADENRGTTVRIQVKVTGPARWIDNISKIAFPLASAGLVAFFFLEYGRY